MPQRLQNPHSIGQMIMVGVQGTHLNDPWIQELLPFIERGLVGGILFFGQNIHTPQQFSQLIASLQRYAPPYRPLLMAIDQEGGRVQRLCPKKGYPELFSAHRIQNSFSPQDAYAHYCDYARILKETGINLNLGPVVDLALGCPVIQGLDRSYGRASVSVCAYAKAFIQAHRHHGILTALKHFPGHGSAQGDTHQGFVDITQTWQQEESVPFQTLWAEGYADMIMTGHLTHRHYDADLPVTLSPHFIKPLLRQRGFQGVVISDDLHMGAILEFYSLEQILLLSLKAGVDLLIFSRNPKSGGRFAHRQKTHTLETIHEHLEKAIMGALLCEEDVKASVRRIQKLKALLG